MARKISKSRDKKPSFFQIVFPDCNIEHLRIPTNFLKHLPRDLTGQATLKLKGSSDRLCTVKVTKTRRGSVYFTDGWMEFLRDNSLGNHEFIVFRYNGKMDFSLTIFETNGSARVENIGSHHNINIANTTKRPRGRPRKYPAISSKKPRPLSSSEDDSGENFSSSGSSEIKAEEEVYEDYTSGHLKAADPESFKSKFPHFKCIIRQPHCLFVPRAFSKAHFPPCKTFEVVLKNAYGKKGAVTAVPGSGSHFLSAGWSTFAHANHIRVGNACMFELLSSKKMMVRLLIHLGVRSRGWRGLGGFPWMKT